MSTERLERGGDAGNPANQDPELGEDLLELGRANIPDEFRGEEGEAQFGPVVDVPASPPVADRLAGFLGRTP